MMMMMKRMTSLTVSVEISVKVSNTNYNLSETFMERSNLSCHSLLVVIANV